MPNEKLITLANVNSVVKSVLSEEVIESLIAKAGADEKFSAITNYATSFLKTGFTKQELSDLILLPHGEKKLKALLEYATILRIEKIFSKHQLYQIASSWDGHKNIEASAKYASILLMWGFSDHQLFLIVTRCYGYKNIESLLKNAMILIQLGFKIEQLVQIVIRYHGYRAIEVLAVDAHTLLNYGFSFEQLITLTTSNTCHEVVKFLVSYATAFLQLGFSIEQLIKISPCYGAYKNIETLLKYLKVLLSLDFSTEQLIEIVFRNCYYDNGVYTTIELLTSYAAGFIKLGFSVKQLIQLIPDCSNATGLETLHSDLEAKTREIYVTSPKLSKESAIEKLREWLTPEKSAKLIEEILIRLYPKKYKVKCTANKKIKLTRSRSAIIPLTTVSIAATSGSEAASSAGSTHRAISPDHTLAEAQAEALKQLKIEDLYFFNQALSLKIDELKRIYIGDKVPSKRLFGPAFQVEDKDAPNDRNIIAKSTRRCK